MTGSPSERAIRDAVTDYLRSCGRQGRVVHELVVGDCRADIAFVERDCLTLFEIKSERDKLDRLGRQMAQFTSTAHAAVLVAHIDWFDTKPYNTGDKRIAATDELRPPAWPRWHLWCYPRSALGDYPYGKIYDWRMPDRSLEQPRAQNFLGLLWKDELIEEAGRHRVSVSSRMTCHDIAAQMAWLMTGREIAESVCRQLRSRRFPEADEPIFEGGCP